MECRDVTEYLLTMDNEATLPAIVGQHLRSCPQCKQDFNALSTAVLSLHAERAAAADTALTVRVMDTLRREAAGSAVPGAEFLFAGLAEENEDPDEQPTTLRNWIIVGTILLASIFGLRFSDAMTWLSHFFGPAIDVAMSVILGVLLTAYICMLVGSNLRRVLRAFGVR